MARKRSSSTCAIILVFIIKCTLLQAKIFSKSLSDFRIIQEPHATRKIDEFVERQKRDTIENTTFTTNSGNHATVHSQNSTLSSTAYTLLGTRGNEVNVHWAGENNNVSQNITDLFIIIYNLLGKISMIY